MIWHKTAYMKVYFLSSPIPVQGWTSPSTANYKQRISEEILKKQLDEKQLVCGENDCYHYAVDAIKEKKTEEKHLTQNSKCKFNNKTILEEKDKTGKEEQNQRSSIRESQE